jgi:hypothetical protein
MVHADEGERDFNMNGTNETNKVFLKFEGRIVFLPYGYLSNYQFIVSETHRTRLNRFLKIFVWFNAVIMFLIIFNIKFLYLLWVRE